LFLWYPSITRVQRIVLLFDAAGLATFAVAGTQKALAYDITPVAAALLGMLTGIGGHEPSAQDSRGGIVWKIRSQPGGHRGEREVGCEYCVPAEHRRTLCAAGDG
jgi:hypothetical protein